MGHKFKPCPIKRCQNTWRTRSGLFSHLYLKHGKAEVVEALLEALGL